MIDRFLQMCVFWLPLSIAFLYLTIAAAHVIKKNYGLATMWAAYGIANFGMIWALTHGEGGGH